MANEPQRLRQNAESRSHHCGFKAEQQGRTPRPCRGNSIPGTGGCMDGLEFATFIFRCIEVISEDVYGR